MGTAIDQKRDVFLSDHYGLTVDLESTGSVFDGTASVRQVLLDNGQVEMEPSDFSILRCVGALVYHVPWLTLRAVGKLYRHLPLHGYFHHSFDLNSPLVRFNSS